MPTISVNGRPFQPASTPLTWGHVLEQIDHRIGSDGLIVTDVHLDGIDEPGFRDPAATGRPLSELAVVEVTTGSPVSLLARCLDEASASLDALGHEAVRLSGAFRAMQIDDGRRGLVEMADGLASLVGIVRASSVVLEVDLETLTCATRPASALVDELARQIEGVLAAQDAGDWITVADILEYDVEPVLQSWQAMLDLLSTRAAP
jgi:hypothetical protein